MNHHARGWWGTPREKRLTTRKSIQPGRRRTLLDRALRKLNRRHRSINT